MNRMIWILITIIAVVPATALSWQSGLGLAAAMGHKSTAVASPAEPVPTPPAEPAPPESAKEAPTEPQAPTQPAVPAAPEFGSPTGWDKAPALESAITRAMASFPGRYSIIVQELATGNQFAVNPSELYHPASTIKMPVTLYALELHRTGRLGWQDGIVYTEADFESPGGGAFETAPFGGVYPVENLVGRALRYSNNVAVNMLGRHLGWQNIRDWTRTIGGELYRRSDGMPQVTAQSELGWWLHLHRLSQEDPKHAELVLQPLREVAYAGRITAGLPAGVPHLHKFGSYDGNYHDGGIVFGTHPYALIVLTGGAQVDEADAAIARVSAAVYQVLSN